MQGQVVDLAEHSHSNEAPREGGRADTATDAHRGAPDMHVPPATLRFRVLTGGAPLAAWQTEVLARLAATPGVQADGLISAAGAPGSGPSAVEVTGDDPLRGREPDFILSFAPPAMGRALAHAARCGVWQFFWGDWARYHGESDGFWEIVDDAEVATALLGQLQEDPDTIRILISGSIRSDTLLPSATSARLRALAAHWPSQVCLELLDGWTAPFESPPVRAGPARRRTARARLACVARGLLRRVSDECRQLARHEQWNVGVIDAPIQSLLEPTGRLAPRWLQKPRRREFYADPIGIVRDGRSTVFCEHLDYRGGSGRIVAFDAGSPERRQPVEIGPPVHLSYPYVIEDGGELYCIPETGKANEVALYRAERFPDRWRRVATLISGIPLIDVTPFRHGERWWLAASLPSPRGSSSELHLYHADALAGPWHPHPGNPVKVDIRSARPGGTPFWKDGVFYRPAQDCSLIYGRRVVINRVLRLTPLAFEEEPAAVVNPPSSGPYRVGLHTVSALGDVTLVDAKRHIFVPEQCWRVLKLGLRKYASGLQSRLGRLRRA